MAQVIDGKSLAAEIREGLAKKAAGMKRPPALAVVLAGEDPPSLVYVESKKKACAEIGIRFCFHQLPEDTTQAKMLALIDELNADGGVDGILVQQPNPIPPHINMHEIVCRVDPRKDVDCLHPYNMGLLTAGNPAMLPCTPAGVVKMINAAGIPTKGKHCVVLGRSNVVGKPLALLMLQQNATVTICHSRTENLPEITRQADILIAAVRQPRFVKADMIKEGAAVIDVGINRLEGRKICGDVDYKDCFNKASFITKVPGGVGPMTVAMLMENCVRAAELAHAE
jgi:methylenetetrahydrofolate dehydrogenase (NADP+)/methenyltetrahydrofolate cyclohydrolase